MQQLRHSGTASRQSAVCRPRSEAVGDPPACPYFQGSSMLDVAQIWPLRGYSHSGTLSTGWTAEIARYPRPFLSFFFSILDVLDLNTLVLPPKSFFQIHQFRILGFFHPSISTSPHLALTEPKVSSQSSKILYIQLVHPRPCHHTLQYCSGYPSIASSSCICPVGC